MLVKFGTTSSAAQVVGKQMTLNEGVDLRLRGINDEVDIDLIVRGSEYPSYNYAEFPGSRFYFITDVEHMGGEKYRLKLSLDVVETYRDLIKGAKSRYRRNLKTGDYVASGFDEATTKTLHSYESDKALEDGSTMILVTVAGK